MRKEKIVTIMLILFVVSLLSGCTLHFKGESLELDTKPPSANIGTTEIVDNNYALTDIDFLDYANR